MKLALRKQKLVIITTVYFFLLLYIIAALIFWYVELEKQSFQMFLYKTELLHTTDAAYRNAAEELQRKKAQYAGEGIVFLLVIFIGAFYVFRATRKEFRFRQQQQNFMMAVTHELKTPIAVVNLNLETLQKRKLSEVQQSTLMQHTLEEMSRFNFLTNNILIASQLEAGSYTLNKQSIHFSELVQKSIHAFSLRHAQRNFISHIEENIFIKGEYTLLEMLINNLIDNAIKYSPKEKNIIIQLYRQNSKAFLLVKDEGTGIAENEKRKVFDKFYRIGSEETRSAKGTGIGLYLCKKIVEDHGGAIYIENNLPSGSVFKVKLSIV